MIKKSYILFILIFTSVMGFSQDLLFWGSAVPNELYSLDLQTNARNTKAINQNRITRIRVDQNLEQVFWSAQFLNKIQKTDASFITTALTDVKTNIAGVGTIAVDGTNNSVYYHLSGGSAIFKCDTLGNNTSTLINFGRPISILGLDIDKSTDEIYWSEITTSGSNSIKKADLPLGNNISVIYNTPDFLFDILVLPQDSSIYFTNRTGNKLQKIKIDGTNLQTLITEINTSTIGTLSGNYCNDVIYYVVNNPVVGTNGSKIKKTDLSGSNPTTLVDTSFSFLAGVDALYQFNIGRRKDFLGPDLTTCQDSVIMNAVVRGGTYLWNNNSTSSAFKVKQSGIYSVTVTAGNCTKVDSIQITVNSNFQVNLGNDTTISRSDSLTISSKLPNATYRWSDGSIADSLIVKTTGTYWVDVTLNGCTKRDFIVINVVPQSTSVSGIINDYAKVNSIQTSSCQDTIFVTDTSGFNLVDGLLIIQMQGASMINGNTNAFGDVTNLNNAGNYEFAIIESVGSNYVLVADVLLKSYSISSNVQIVTVPTFTNITIQNNLTALKWDGNKGGILALNVSDTITLNGSIDVDSCGFREGRTYSGPLYPLSGTGCSRTDYFAPFGNFNGGEKGEGIAINPNTQNYGRGHSSNGGGGGNSHNSGGAGGGNAGTGGTGGNEFSNCSSPTSIGGIGGQVISTSILVEKAFLGGGGGAGDANFSAGTSGGSGGGLIFLKSDVIVANSNLISAQGEEASTSTSDGAGGGGAGGTIFLDVRSVIGSLTVNSNAGRGGNMNNGGSCVGPGGGGGGGIINYSNSGILPNSLLIANGAQNGISTNPVAPCFNSNYGATAGTNGLVLSNLTSLFNRPTSSSLTTILGNDTSICFGDSITLNSFFLGAAYLWNDSSTNSTLKVKQSGIYSVTVTAGNCTKVDSITITVNPNFTVDIGVDTTLCFNDSILLNATTLSASYLWSNNSTTSGLQISSKGTYWVDVSVNGCTKRDSISIIIHDELPLFLGNDTTICFNDSVQFNLDFLGYSYLWSDGSTDSVFTIKREGAFWADLTLNGCVTRDSIYVSIFNSTLINLGNDTTLCFGDSIILNIDIPPPVIVKWSDNSTNSSLKVKSTGFYYVDVTLVDCTIRDSIAILFTSEIGTNFFPNDTTLCNGDSIDFDFGQPNQSYLWSDSTTISSNTFKQEGLYWLEISENGCASRDSLSLRIKEQPIINLGPDTSLCEGELFGTSYSNLNTGYLWNTGSNDTSIAVKTTGIYWLEVLLDGCIFRDSIALQVKPIPSIDLGPDTTLCFGDTIALSQSSFTAMYLWNDSTTGVSIETFRTGNYWLDFTVNGCSTRDSIRIETFDSLGASSLPQTATLCGNGVLNYQLPLQNSNYRWQDGSLDPNYSISDTGLYFVQVSNTCGSRTDSLQVTKDCECKVSMPNAFTPNNDLINDQFIARISCELEFYAIEIYNRWGGKVFESVQQKQAWDGTINGRKPKNGVYYYVLRYKTSNENVQTLKGSLLLSQ